MANRWDEYLASINPKQTIGETSVTEFIKGFSEVFRKAADELPDEYNANLQGDIPSETLELNAWLIRLKEYADAGDDLIPSDNLKRLSIGFWNRTKKVRIETGLLQIRDLVAVVTKETCQCIGKSHNDLKAMFRTRDGRMHIVQDLRG